MKKYRVILVVVIFVIISIAYLMAQFQVASLKNERQILLKLLAKERELESLLTQENQRLAAQVPDKAKKQVKTKAAARQAAPAAVKTKAAARTQEEARPTAGNRGYLIKNGKTTFGR